MRSFAWLIALWLTLSPALADSAYVAPTATGQAATGQVPGTATNDSANAGNVGQTITANATVSLSNNTAANVTSGSITAGDWDAWCSFKFTPAAGTTVTTLIGEVSPTSATVPATLGNYFQFSYEAASAAGAVALGFSTPQVPLSLSTPTTYFCVAYSIFGVSTLSVDGKLVARRRR